MLEAIIVVNGRPPSQHQFRELPAQYYDVVLGIPWLQDQRVAMSFNKRLLWFEDNEEETSDFDDEVELNHFVLQHSSGIHGTQLNCPQDGSNDDRPLIMAYVNLVDKPTLRKYTDIKWEKLAYNKVLRRRREAELQYDI
jgi:hypothetical protein